MAFGGQCNALTTLPQEKPGTPSTEGYVGPQRHSGRCRKPCPPSEFKPSTIQPLVILSTNCSILPYGVYLLIN